MALFTSEYPCQKCQKGRGQVICGGCQQWFCLQHLIEHRQELSQRMDNVFVEHNQLQQNLTQNNNEDDKQHHLISQIAQWELKSIERIKHFANKAREQLRKSFDLSKSKIKRSLHSITDELQVNQQGNTYTEIDLLRWMNQLRELQKKLKNSPKIEIKYGEAGETSAHDIPLIQLRILDQGRVPGHIFDETKWLTNGQTVAGVVQKGDTLNQLNDPYGIDIDDDGTLVIADMNNHRIIRWKQNALEGEIIAGGKGKGTRTDHLNQPVAVLIDRKNGCLLVSEEYNRRVMRWPLDIDKRKRGTGEILIPNIICFGLALDNEGSLYVSDYERHEVRRYRIVDRREEVIVAGGNGQGSELHQLNGPRNIFVDDDQSVYVSDTENHRVMRWSKNERVGKMVAGGQGRGNSSGNLFRPSGILVDQTMGSVYVADQENHRLMRWSKNAKVGEIIIGDHGQGSQKDQLFRPASILFDNQGNLLVVDRNNHRIQRFEIQ